MQAFFPTEKTLKWTGFARPFEFHEGDPTGQVLWGEQVIGTKFVLYRESHSKPKEKRIQMVKQRKIRDQR